MKEYNIEIPNYTEFEKKLQKETDFFKYMGLLKEALPNYVLIIAVCDSAAGPTYTPAHAESMMNALGLKINMINGFRMPYIAVIDHGNLVYESTSNGREEPVIVNGTLGKHSLAIFSGGWDCNYELGMNAAVTIDGTRYYGVMGYNFFVYDVEKDYFVDMHTHCNFAVSLENNPMGNSISSIENIILNLPTRGGGLLCLFKNPEFTPLPIRTEHENRIAESGFNALVTSKNDLEYIWDNNIFNFVSDFESKEDFLQVITPVDSYDDIDGIMKFKDYESKVVNTKNGIRVTTNQPLNPKRAIYLFGPCTTFGIGSEDKYTIASCLQRKLNENIPEEGFIVYNYGFYLMGFTDGGERLNAILKSLPIKENDIIFFDGKVPLYGIPFCDLTEKSKRPHDYGDILLDRGGHFTANGNRMIADGIFDFLAEYDFFKDAKMNIVNAEALGETKYSETHENELLTKYKDNLKNFFKENISPKVGAIVMNANPFTYGHRALVDEALKNCDYLIVFVVEEDKSDVPFKDRIALVRENLKDLSRVFVMPSGEFIISSKTFSEYFRKEHLQEQKIDTSQDVTLFAKEIAPCLNITIRFAGEEPTDKVTAQYNEDMARILPLYGVEFMEIKRKVTSSGEVISASTVRKLAQIGEFEKLKELVPPPTLEYLRKKYR